MDVELGPIDYLVVRFPGSKMTGEGLPLLVDLADRNIIRILDLRVVKRELDGSVVQLEIADLDGDGSLDLAVFAGAASGLLDDEDNEAAISLVEPGDTAAVIVYENTWAGPFVSALRRGGAEPISTGRIPVNVVLEALDRLDAADAASV